MKQISILKLQIPLVTIAIFVTTLLLVTYAAPKGDPNGSSRLRAAESAGGSFPSVRSEIEVELTTLRPQGFEPLEITRPKGAFVLLVDDRSGKENSSLVLERVKGERLRTVILNRVNSEWHELIDLPPDTYILRDASSPEPRCQITILP